jgi:formylglycine-generating enzyme required for sulfatase activity
MAGANWTRVQEYITALNARTGNRFQYRLPTEAEWEYAARAGTTTPFWTGQRLTTEQANFDDSFGNIRGSYRRQTTPVTSFTPNAWGLHDVHGNVSEWVQDCYGPYSGAPTDGSALTADNCAQRVLRGGAWNEVPKSLRTANRYWAAPSDSRGAIGFRLARTVR